MHGDNYGSRARPDGSDGLLAAQVTVDAIITDGEMTGNHVIDWGVPYQAQGPVVGTISTP